MKTITHYCDQLITFLVIYMLIQMVNRYGFQPVAEGVGTWLCGEWFLIPLVYGYRHSYMKKDTHE